MRMSRTHHAMFRALLEPVTFATAPVLPKFASVRYSGADDVGATSAQHLNSPNLQPGIAIAHDMSVSMDGFPSGLDKGPRDATLNIPELISAIAQQVDDQRTLVAFACSSKGFTDICLGWLWQEPVFNGSPLITMLNLFRGEIGTSLQESQDPDLQVSDKEFERFDYYAKFIRSINLWHHGREAYVARILTSSRFGVWLFPSLVDLRLGATGEELETVRAYLTPTLRSLWLNHWDGQGGREITPNPALKKTLIQVCHLADLESLDMADTLYTPMEDDPDLVKGFAQLASQLVEFRSQSFLTLPAVFETLSLSLKLRSVFLNTTNRGSLYVPLMPIVRALREHFPMLDTLGLYCTMEQAVTVFDNLDRSIPHINLKISTAMEAGDLHAVVSSIFSSIDTLRSLRISSAGNLHRYADPPIRLSEVLAPLRACRELRKLEIILSFSGDQMMHNDEIAQFFRAWPDLELCTILNDAEGDLVAVEGEDTSFGLSLDAVLSAARYCPQLKELTLPFVDTTNIPDADGVPRTDHAMTFQLSSTHVHNLPEVTAFMAQLWRGVDVITSGCEHFRATRTIL
ncbi:hypothetical protein CALVIDRAFT_538543 [Calocera viscosa TUFC12733]|uniref:Uncharacterized protein n=1 Tax=Calocera viscosa (strain TUFC12733) TaxID=1330018 RepID=A0A167KW70_CALVF|nr:hypothetical protein CALVIDRAFT_538543 [Calocera viscosa TUFC12733]